MSSSHPVVFVAFIEFIYYILEIYASNIPPAMLYCSHGATIVWLRYVEWLMTCPVLLIHLSNITGLGEEYSHRTMKLLVCDQGTVLMGVTAAASGRGVKIFFFICGLGFGLTTFYIAAQVYIASYHQVPRGKCRSLVRAMAWTYFVSWPLFPVMFLFGPEGFGIITLSGSYIGHCVIDFISKNVWSVIGWYLRYEVRRFILVNGEVTRKQEIEILGRKIEVMEYLDTEQEKEYQAKGGEIAEHVQRNPTKAHHRRASFARLAQKMEKQGIKMRDSLEMNPYHASRRDATLTMDTAEKGFPNSAYSNAPTPGMPPVAPYGAPQRTSGYYDKAATQSGFIVPNRICVVTAAMDEQLVRFFEMQLESMPTMVRCESAPSFDALRSVLAALQSQGVFVDVVLMQPAFAQSFPGVVDDVRRRGIPVILFSANPSMRAQMGADDFIDGPQFGMPFRTEELSACITRWHDSPARPRFEGAATPTMQRASMGMNMGGQPNLPPGQESDVLMSLLGEISRLRNEVGMRRDSGGPIPAPGFQTPGALSAQPSMTAPANYGEYR